MKKTPDTTLPSTRQSKVFGLESAVPGLLVAHAPASAAATDRVAVPLPFTVGRAGDCGLPVDDQKMSKQHFRIAKDNAGYWVEDMGSTNGTFVQGARVSGTAPLPNQGVIRAGGSVFVFCLEAETVLKPPPAERFGLAGRFHVGAIVQQMREAAESSRHVLLSGPSGFGPGDLVEAETGRRRGGGVNAGSYDPNLRHSSTLKGPASVSKGISKQGIPVGREML